MVPRMWCRFAASRLAIARARAGACCWSICQVSIFAAVTTAVDEGGPDALTVQNVAERVGVTAPAVRQRFGSKRALLLAYAEHQVLNAAHPFSAPSADETGPV